MTSFIVDEIKNDYSFIVSNSAVCELHFLDKDIIITNIICCEKRIKDYSLAWFQFYRENEGQRGT